MIFLPHTNTVILLEPYCGTITEPGLPVTESQNVRMGALSFRLALPSAVSSSILRQTFLTDKEERVYYLFTKRTSLESMPVGYESQTEFNIEWQI